MSQHDLELSDFTEPFGPRYSCALSYTDFDGWVGLCEGPRGFHCEVVGITGEECCEAALRRVVEHYGCEECELSYSTAMRLGRGHAPRRRRAPTSARSGWHVPCVTPSTRARARGSPRRRPPQLKITARRPRTRRLDEMFVLILIGVPVLEVFVSSRRAPGSAAVDGALGFLGALLLVLPGFVTAALGALLR
jgi:hypothetical protein